MVVLALETVTPAGSLALWRDGDLRATLGDAAVPHAARLPMALADFLADAALTLDDVTRLAVVCGPGSFTGVRIGMACAQGLAVTRGWRVAAVSTLEAIADGWRAQRASTSAHTVLACLDGMRGEVFTAAYHWDGNALACVREAEVGSPSAALIDAHAGPVVVVGNGALRYVEIWRAAGAAEVIGAAEPIAASAARLAARSAWPCVAPAALRPVYVRRPDVELARDRRAAQV